MVGVSACVQAAIIAPAVAVFYPDVNVGLFTASALGNGIAFPLGFSIPLVILMQEELGFMPLRAFQPLGNPSFYNEILRFVESDERAERLT